MFHMTCCPSLSNEVHFMEDLWSRGWKGYLFLSTPPCINGPERSKSVITVNWFRRIGTCVAIFSKVTSEEGRLQLTVIVKAWTSKGKCSSSKPSLKVPRQSDQRPKGPFRQGQALSSTSLISTGDAVHDRFKSLRHGQWEDVYIPSHRCRLVGEVWNSSDPWERLCHERWLSQRVRALHLWGPICCGELHHFPLRKR